jgi:hypothetical protein
MSYASPILFIGSDEGTFGESVFICVHPWLNFSAPSASSCSKSLDFAFFAALRLGVSAFQGDGTPPP